MSEPGRIVGVGVDRDHGSELLRSADRLVVEIEALRVGVELESHSVRHSRLYHPVGRRSGSLACYRNHRLSRDPLAGPGEQDITAHVDFSALAGAAQEAELEVLGYANQMQFLVNCGITDLLAEVDASDLRRYAPLAAEAQTLLSPAEMGELFKVLVLGRGIDPPLRGFAEGNRAQAL